MKKFISAPIKPVEPRKTIEKQIRSDVVEVGAYTSFSEIFSLLPEYEHDEISIDDVSGDYGKVNIQIVGSKYEEVPNDKYESELKKYQKDLEKYKEDLKRRKDWEKQEKKKQKEIEKRKELELYRKLEKKYEK